MRHLVRVTKRRVTPVLSACALMAAGIGASAFTSAGTADAATCTSTPVVTPTACTITGTLTMTAGNLSLVSPLALGWTETANGLDQRLVDPTPADQSFLVSDSTGTGPGWHITASATTFTSAGPHTLNNSGTLAVNGSLTLTSGALTVSTPGSACLSTSTCTVPVPNITYPVAITTAPTTPTAVSIYNATALTGLGSINVGASSGGNPVGWWLFVPGNTIQGTYTSTVTLSIITAP